MAGVGVKVTEVPAQTAPDGLAAMDGIESAGGLAQPTLGPLDPARATTNFVIFRVGPRGSSAAVATTRRSATRPA